MFATIETKFAKLLGVGLGITTVLVIAGPVSDPVNATKLLAIGIFSFAMIPYFFYVGKNQLIKINSVPTKLSFIFVLTLAISVVSSDAPFVQNLYGVNGRNTGFLAQLFFVIIFVASSNLFLVESHNFIIKCFLLAGGVNVFYGFIDKFFGDPIPWNNIYGAFLGTLGNPNFAGAFLGLIVGASLALVIDNFTNYRSLILYGLLFFTSVVVVLFTKTTQGILVSGFTIGIVILIYLFNEVKKRIIPYVALIVFLITGLMVIFGILQKGPLVQFLYKRSVSLRGVYWDTAIQVGNSHPFTGVGLDAYGDWYRTERSLKAATWLPGPETIANAAHNLYLDMYANGGLPLLLSYLSFTALGILNCVKIIKRTKGFDPLSAILISVFAGFQIQSLISIAQIGIAIWGWAVIGLLHSYAKILQKTELISNKKVSKTNKLNSDSPIGVFMFVAAAIGLFLAIPPFSADYKYLNATKSQSVERVEASLIPGYFNPQSSQRFAFAIMLLEQSNFNDLAHKYALQAVEFNSHSYDAWKLLYVLKKSSPEDRKLALQMMRKIDPLNRNLEKLK